MSTVPTENDEWVQVKALGWAEEKYLQLPEATRIHIEACAGVRKVELNAKSDTSRAHFRDARDLLESNLPIPEEAFVEVGQAKEKMLAVIRRHLEEACIPRAAIKAILAGSDADTAADEEFYSEVQMHVVAKAMFHTRLALDEAFVNHLKHGLHGDPRGTITAKARIENGVFHLETKDSGLGFIPEHVRDPLAEENLDRSSGRGLLLMRSYMTTVDILEEGTMYRMTKNILDYTRRKSWEKLVKESAEELRPPAPPQGTDDAEGLVS